MGGVEGRPVEYQALRPPQDAEPALPRSERVGKASQHVPPGPQRSVEEARDTVRGGSDQDDSLRESLRQTARDAGDVLAAAPQAAASAASTAAEIAGGVVEHVTGRSKEGLSPPDPSTSSGDRDASSTRAAAAASVPGAMGETHAAQLERLAQGGRRPAHERETLTDKILEPITRDTFDEERAKELATSYKNYKAKQAQGGQEQDTATPQPG
ncbi:hypothetical protein MNEG_13524, partial [Monoraphidium neglectum]